MLLLRKIVRGFAKQKPIDAFKQFLEHDAGSSVRTASQQKDRKYLHVEITEQFKQQEQKRKQLRLEQMKQRKILLEQKLTTESKLITSVEDEELKQLNQEIVSLEQLLNSQSHELEKIDKDLQDSEARLVVIEGSKKLVVLNKIEYLKHMNYHPSGLVLHPQTVKIIENVHYLVNNNLPVNKFKLFEIMPEIFQTQIKELEESMQKLIEQKKLDPTSDPSGRIRFFVKHKSRFVHPEQQTIDLDQQRRAVFENMEDEIVRLMDPHMEYVRLVQQGLTPFRSTMHMIHVLTSDKLPLKLTETEQALRNTLVEIVQLKDKFKIYSDQINKKIIQVRYKYIEPPEWIKDHPVLRPRYDKVMLKYTNPQEVTQFLEERVDDDGQAFLREKLDKLMIDKYNPITEELWNSGRRDELIANKKKLEIDFYHDSTRILEEYHELIADQKEKEEFLKISKRPRQIQQKHASVTLDDLTKTIFVNNQNPVKYNIEFFTNYLGLENQEQAHKLFNSFSYLRVPVQQEQSIDKLKVEIIKFKGP